MKRIPVTADGNIALSTRKEGLDTSEISRAGWGGKEKLIITSLRHTGMIA